MVAVALVPAVGLHVLLKDPDVAVLVMGWARHKPSHGGNSTGEQGGKFQNGGGGGGGASFKTGPEGQWG